MTKFIPVFDIGDTLMPCYRLQKELFEQVFEENGRKPPNFEEEDFKIYKKRYVQKYLDEKNLELDAEELIERYKRKEQDFLENEDVFGFLDKCAEEFGSIGFISDNTVEGKKWFKRLLEEHDIDYKGFVVSEEVGVEKPDKQIFNAFINRRDEEPEKFVYIGNNIPKDKAAKKVGMGFIWFNAFETFGTSYDKLKLEKLDVENLQNTLNQIERIVEK